MPPPFPPELDLAQGLAVEAGRLLLERSRSVAQGVGTKTTGTDMVSDADRDAETLIVTGLSAEYPDDGILGEEGASRPGASGRTWVIDPLDGTTNYLFGHDGYAVSVALEDSAGGVVGCVHDPVRDETFVAWRGGGAWIGSVALHPRPTVDLGEVLLGTGFSYRADQRAWQGRVVADLLPQVRDIRRRGAAALDLCWVAAGRLDAHVERGLAPWDHAAGALVVAEAGAMVSQIDRNDPWPLVAVSAPGVATELMDAVHRAEASAGDRPS